MNNGELFIFLKKNQSKNG